MKISSITIRLKASLNAGLEFLPLIIPLIAIAFITWYLFYIPLNDYKDLTNSISDSIKLATNTIIELNKYLISINTSLFGFGAFIMKDYQSNLKNKFIGLAFYLALFLLAADFYFAFRVYTDLLNSLAQNQIALHPNNSKVMYYLNLQFIACTGSSISLLSVFVSAFYVKGPKSQ